MTQAKKRRGAILKEAHTDAMEICQISVEYFIRQFRRLPPSVACDAEEIAGKCQQYLKKYGD